MPGPAIRTDVVDVYVFRRRAQGPGVAGGVEFLQLRRVEEPAAGTWQPVMGHIEADEAPTRAAVRELGEEIGLRPGMPGWLGLWALQEVRPYYLASANALMMSVCFALEVDEEFEPHAGPEHNDHRWVWSSEAERAFLWLSQRAACEEILREIVPPDSAVRDLLRVG
ncbi:MAG: NUDIX domain-containing protein [Leptolyngbya sp. PLA1]|nr:NUDIX domain-containing protein [Leptolyngbya sp. PLA1]